jgi:hypothetical protein
VRSQRQDLGRIAADSIPGRTTIASVAGARASFDR